MKRIGFYEHYREKNYLVLQRYARGLSTDIHLNADESIAAQLQRMAIEHFKRFSFSSLYFNVCQNKDPLQNKPLLLNRNALIHELITNQDGSCYHHNALFQAILEFNNIDSWFVSCRVHDPMNPEKIFDMDTHIAIVFKVDNQLYLFDPGWDGTSLSVYPIPKTMNTVIQDGHYQIKYTEHPDYPFSLEEIKTQGIVTRFDFNTKKAPLEQFEHAIDYLNSKDYAFDTLFLFTKIDDEARMIRLVNRRLMIQRISGEMLHNEQLPDDISIADQLRALFGPQEGLTNLCVDDFKNPTLGALFCNALEEPQPSMTII